VNAAPLSGTRPPAEAPGRRCARSRRQGPSHSLVSQVRAVLEDNGGLDHAGLASVLSVNCLYTILNLDSRSKDRKGICKTLD
jgi:hypothetical protein